MPEDVNPYASPAAVNEVAEDPAAAALRRLRGPSLGLLLLGGLVAIMGTLWIPLMLVAALLTLFFPSLSRGRAEDLFMVPMLLASYPTVYCAWKMRSGNSYRWAYTAAVLSCIPVLSPFIYFGIPVGVWALIVLHRRDVKEAFARRKDGRTAAETGPV